MLVGGLGVAGVSFVAVAAAGGGEETEVLVPPDCKKLPLVALNKGLAGGVNTLDPLALVPVTLPPNPFPNDDEEILAPPPPPNNDGVDGANEVEVELPGGASTEVAPSVGFLANNDGPVVKGLARDGVDEFTTDPEVAPKLTDAEPNEG